MTRALPTVCCVLLLSHAAHAKQDGDPSHLLYTCTPSSRIQLSLDDASGASSSSRTKTKPEAIDIDKLVVYGKPDEQGTVHRAATRTIKRTCGTLRLEVTGGYFNENTQGEWGAAEDYPIIEVFDGKRSLTGPIGVGACDATNTRSSFMVACPANWATVITVFESGGKFVVDLNHSYEEWRSP